MERLGDESPDRQRSQIFWFIMPKMGELGSLAFDRVHDMLDVGYAISRVHYFWRLRPWAMEPQGESSNANQDLRLRRSYVVFATVLIGLMPTHREAAAGLLGDAPTGRGSVTGCLRVPSSR